MKKILMISGSLPPIRCGVGYYTHRLLMNFKSSNIEFDILTSAGADSDFKQSRYFSVADWKIRRVPRLIRHARHSGAELIHIQYPTVPYKRQLGINLLPWLIRLFIPRVKLIVTLHEYYGSSRLGRMRSRLTARPAKRIIVSNNWDYYSLPNRLRKRSVIIPIGSNLDIAPRSTAKYTGLLKKNGLDPELPTIIFFGFAFPNKGLENLINAMAAPTLDDWQLLLLSSLEENDDYQRNLIGLIKKLNKEKRKAAVAGFLSDEEVSIALQEGKYFILPQPLPLSPKSSTAIAAVQHGLIVVSTGSDTPKMQLPFKHEENCYLLDSMTPEGIAKSIASIETDPKLRREIGEGLKDLQKYFGWENIVEAHERLYEELQ
jgi:glycosyltransferase involved in cell wall biosynthesis